MKTYYIPTTTLNFDNILSSESISPKSFYQQRNFGYKNWLTIPENGKDDAILLYDKPFKLQRTSSEVEDHPLFIEVNLNEELPEIAKGIYYCDHTIHISPINATFLFLTEKDKNTTLTLSGSYSETKTLELYTQKKIQVKALSGKRPSIPSRSIDIDNNKINKEIKKDIQFNKLRGLLSGYYIGALLSTSKQNVIRLSALRKIYNIFVAIQSSMEHKATSKQREELYELSRLSSPLYSELLSTLDGYIPNNTVDKKSLVEKIMAIIRKNITGEIKDSINIEQSLSTLESPIDEAKSSAIANIEEIIDNQINKIEKEQNPLDTKKDEIIITDNSLHKVKAIENKTEHTLFSAWVNEILNQYDRNFNQTKMELANAITQKTKDILNKNWEKSHARIFLNALRHHIAGEPFNMSWDNGIYSSFAAVLIAGNSWDALLHYMEEKGMTDYRLAFSIYGYLNGYANLTRDFTDNLYSIYNKNPLYIADIYREFYGQLGCPIPETSAQAKPKNSQQVSASKTENKEVSSEETQGSLSNEETNEALHSYNNDSKTKKQAKKTKPSASKADKKTRKPITLKETQGTLFDNEEINEPPYFYNDNQAWKKISKLPEIASMTKNDREKLKKDLSWFQEEMRKPQKERGYFQELNEEDDQKTINAFCKLKIGKLPYFTPELRDIVKKTLEKIYIN